LLKYAQLSKISDISLAPTWHRYLEKPM